MANNKVVFGEEVLIDLTQDTVTPYALEEGYTAHAPSGEKIVGVMKPNKPVEVETNEEMTTISTGATEKDIGKVYLFVGEDDGVFEKDALYILVKKGTGYGFQRYAIGGSGEESTPLQEKTVEITENGTTEVLPDEGYGLSRVVVTTNVAGREDLDAELNEQEALIAELKEKLANGGGNGGSQECDCIIDVTELPKSAEIWGAMEGQTLNLADYVASMSGSVTIYTVDELPDTMAPSNMDNLAITAYILNSTGIAYVSQDGTPATAVTVGVLFGGAPDKGWVDDISTIDPTDEAQMGLYCVRGEPIDENAVYRKSVDECEVWLVADGETQTYSDFWAKFGATVQAKYYLVDTLPDTMEKFQTIISDTHVIRNFYILKDTGIAYCSEDGTKENAVTLTTGMTITDKGWVDDIDSIDNTDSAQEGAYTTRSQYIAFYTNSDGKWNEYQGDVKTAEEIKNKVRKTVEAFDEFFNYSSDVIQPIVIPEGVNDIGHTIIYGDNVWGIEKITFPKSLMRLYKGAVRACPNLETVIFKGKPLNVNYQAFMECDAIKHIYVPWAEGEVEHAPWGAPSTATIHYNADTSAM